MDDGIDDGLAHVSPARVVHVSQHVGVRLVGQESVEQRHMAVLQHAVVVVQPRVLVPRVYQERVVQACFNDTQMIQFSDFVKWAVLGASLSLLPPRPANGQWLLCKATYENLDTLLTATTCCCDWIAEFPPRDWNMTHLHAHPHVA